MNLVVRLGQPVPYFEGKDTSDQLITSENLLGNPYLIYFYPKDDTPGCTKEACAFRDAKAEYENLGVKIIGVSGDDKASHLAFMEKHQLNFQLLVDKDHLISNIFGVWQEKNQFGQKKFGIVRSTFLVDENGIIKWVESPVDIEGHADRVLEAIKKYT